jgi:parallel beta-helix repeat protein
MKINGTVTILLALLIISLVGLATISKPAMSTPDIIQVSPGESIQAAINTASLGDTILVAAGTYVENVVINQTITLMGSGYNVTFLEALNKAKPVIDVGVSSVKVTKFTIQGGSTGVSIVGQNAINISDNRIISNQNEGIALDSSLNNIIIGNLISLNSYEGVYLQLSNNTMISDNIILGNRWGVGLLSSSDNRISNNTVAFHSASDGNGIYMDNYGELYTSTGNTFDGNTIRNNTIGISIFMCNSSIFYHNNFINNTDQIDSFESANSWNTTTDGNYWSDYTGTGPYKIDELTNNNDYFPLLNPWGTIFDVTPPVTADDYNDLWHTADFTIHLSAVDDLSGVNETYYILNGGSISNVSANGQPYITVENSNNTLEYWSVDEASLEETPHHILTDIKLDKTVPSGSIQINNGAAYTISLSVTLNLSATDSTSGVSQMQFSTSGNSWTLPIPYNTTKAWNLTSGDGIKTIYVQYKDAAGLLSQAYSDTIILDTVSPVVIILSPSAGSEVKSSDVTVHWNGTDTGLGVDHFEIRLDQGSAIGVGVQETYTFRDVSDGGHTAYVMAFDKIGQSTEVSVSFTVNTSPLGGVGYFEEAGLVVVVIVVVGVLVYYLRARRKRRR